MKSRTVQFVGKTLVTSTPEQKCESVGLVKAIYNSWT